MNEHDVDVHLLGCTDGYRIRLQQCIGLVLKFTLDFSELRFRGVMGTNDISLDITGQLTIPPLWTTLHAFCTDGYPSQHRNSLASLVLGISAANIMSRCFLPSRPCCSRRLHHHDSRHSLQNNCRNRYEAQIQIYVSFCRDPNQSDKSSTLRAMTTRRSSPS